MKEQKKIGFYLSAVALIAASLISIAANAQNVRHRMLIYTRNGKGYVHENIAASVAAVKKLGAEAGLEVDVTDDPEYFEPSRLSRYAVLVFANTNNEAFLTDQQRDAFKGYIEHGGGFVGLHSASGSERSWPYFASVLGGRFVEHPPQQVLTVEVLDQTSPFTKGLAAQVQHKDECYFFTLMNPDIHPLLGVRRSTLINTEKMKLDLKSYPEMLPVAWYHTFDGGREFYLALGHNKEDYDDPMILNLIRRGIRWASGAEEMR
jgi:type 1 glutamine amidotransferase